MTRPPLQYTTCARAARALIVAMHRAAKATADKTRVDET